MPSTLQLGSFT